MLSVRRPTGASGGGGIALGWLVTKPSDDEIVGHNGGTGGYRSFIGYDAKTRVGVVVLSNTSTASGGDDIGIDLLDSHLLLLPPPKEHINGSITHHLITRPLHFRPYPAAQIPARQAQSR